MIEEDWKEKRRIFWEEYREAPAYKIYDEFRSKTYPSWRNGYKSSTEVLDELNEIPLIGLEKAENLFENHEYYHRPFFLFEQNTPTMKRISTEEVIDQNLKFMGNLHGIIWGRIRSPGHSSDDHYCHGPQELFTRLAQHFQDINNKVSAPTFFNLEISGSREYDGDEVRKSYMLFGEISPVYCLTLFGGKL